MSGSWLQAGALLLCVVVGYAVMLAVQFGLLFAMARLGLAWDG